MHTYYYIFTYIQKEKQDWALITQQDYGVCWITALRKTRYPPKSGTWAETSKNSCFYSAHYLTQ